MSKTKEEVRVEGRPVVYSILFNPMKKAAIELGWMLTIHGSMHSDLDLIAVPWTEEAKPHEELVKALSDCLGPTIWKDYHFKEHTDKPHGRKVYTLSIFTDWYIDLSIIPLKQHPENTWPNRIDAKKLLAIRDSLCESPADTNEAFHQLCTIADPELINFDHWAKLEKIAK